MEGLASFMGQDEDSKDVMVTRDAVVNDQVPPITKNPQGYFAYRFGHAVFKFIQTKWGWEGLRDFIYEYRNTLGSSVDRAVKRAFDLTPEEFDTQFRTWLRKQYLPALVAKGEPQEYGEPFKIQEGVESEDISPAPSPSGDLLTGFSTYKEDVDLVLYNVPQRRMLKNLTTGYTSRYEYAIVQMFTVGPTMGRDEGWSPSGDQVALFVKRERGRNLLIVNALTGTIEKSIPMKVEQQLSPSWSPDGRKIAFSGFLGNQPDIFLYDIVSGEVTNLTNDKFFDGAPVFSPDGKWLVYSSVVDGYAKLFKLNLSNPSERYQLTTGQWNDIDAYFSPDGKRIFFASDKQTGRNVETPATSANPTNTMATPPPPALAATSSSEPKPAGPDNFAAYNIYSLNLDNGDLLQYTDVVGGCFMPVVFTGQNNKERMVFSSYYKRQWRLYSTPTDKPLHAAEKVALPTAPIAAESRTQFQPPVEVAIDPEKTEKAHSKRLFIDDVQVNAGVSSDQLLISQSVIYMSDMLGNHRFIAALDSVSTFSNFDFLYFDLTHRTNWGVRLFDNRSFYLTPNADLTRIDRRQDYRETGALGIISYPFTRYHRIDLGAGYEARDVFYPVPVTLNGQLFYTAVERRDNFPLVTSTFTGDTSVFKIFGPIAGHRYELGASFAPDIKNGGVLSNDVSLDARKYIPITSRSLIATRLFLAHASGNAPNFYYFGGLNTVRGYDFRSIIGNTAGFANVEFRFPLVDVLATPILVLQQMRGNIFFDIGGAKLKGQPYTFIKNHRLVDGASSVGWGFSFNFLGLELHWDFARRFDLKNTIGNTRTEFWIGETF
jgi:Tol biopolymer transport system component